MIEYKEDYMEDISLLSFSRWLHSQGLAGTISSNIDELETLSILDLSKKSFENFLNRLDL